MSEILTFPYLALIGRGLLMTMFIAGFVIVVSNAIALGIAVYMLDAQPVFRRLIVAYSFFARATPALAILFALYYGLPRVGIYLDPLSSALIGLTLSSSAYNYEFLRSGFAAIHRSQIEAANSLGMRRFTTLWKVMVPQAYAVAAPSLFSNAIQMVKGSSLASLVTIDELTAASTTIAAETYKAIEVFLTVSAFYLAIAGVIVGLQTLYERSIKWHHMERR